MRRVFFAFGVFFGGCGAVGPGPIYDVAVRARLCFENDPSGVPAVRDPTEPIAAYRRSDGCVGIFDVRGGVTAVSVSLVDPPVGIELDAGVDAYTEDARLCLHPSDATVEVLLQMTVAVGQQ